MEFLDEMPEEEEKKDTGKKIQTEKPDDGFNLEIGSLTFYMGEVELEIKDVKVRDMEDFRKMIFEVLSQ
jgi:hypothetical protein